MPFLRSWTSWRRLHLGWIDNGNLSIYWNIDNLHSIHWNYVDFHWFVNFFNLGFFCLHVICQFNFFNFNFFCLHEYCFVSFSFLFFDEKFKIVVGLNLTVGSLGEIKMSVRIWNSLHSISFQHYIWASLFDSCKERLVIVQHEHQKVLLVSRIQKLDWISLFHRIYSVLIFPFSRLSNAQILKVTSVLVTAVGDG